LIEIKFDIKPPTGNNRLKFHLNIILRQFFKCTPNQKFTDLETLISPSLKSLLAVDLVLLLFARRRRPFILLGRDPVEVEDGALLDWTRLASGPR
jgi:hypothetical protein